jgi:hypothetical protein
MNKLKKTTKTSVIIVVPGVEIQNLTSLIRIDCDFCLVTKLISLVSAINAMLSVGNKEKAKAV